MDAPRSTPTTLLKRFPGLPFFAILMVLVAVVHFWQPSNPLQWGMGAALFTIGGILAHVLFLFEKQLGELSNRIGDALANNQLTSDLPEVQREPTPTDPSPLKQGLILFLLPILGLFLISSSRAAIGHGFLLGISWIYGIDIVNFLRSKPSEFPSEYFPPQQAQSQTVQIAIAWYCLYMVAFLLAFLVF